VSYLPICSDCGWCGTRTRTPGIATKAGQMHSCDKYRRVQASHERGQQLRVSIDRTPKPCQHKQAQHQHGTYVTYTLDSCRCRSCSAAAVAYERTRKRQKAYGRWQPTIDAQPVREHVAQLQAQGLGLKRIAQLSGVAQGALWKLMYGKTRPDGSRTPSKTVRPQTAAALLTLTADLEHLGSTVCVDGLGTRRRLQALVAAGWSQRQLAARLDMAAGNFGRVIHADRVYASTARAVRTLYDQLARHAPPENNRWERQSAARARNLARSRGWQPAMWWDDDELDSADITPDDPPQLAHDDIDDVAVLRACEGDPTIRLTLAERREVVRRLHARGLSDNRIAATARMTSRTVLRIRQELDLPANASAA
jgi:hypothetical protein